MAGFKYNLLFFVFFFHIYIMSSLEIISLKNNILLNVNKTEIKTAIIKRITDLNLDLVKWKIDPEFLSLLCNMIEHLVQKKDGINKLDFAIEIVNEMLSGSLTQDEINIIKNTIDFIHKNKSIKKVSYWKLFKCGIREWLGLKKKA
jgi:hypothetical protein